ncbi:hypothetical protein ATANTOWER_025545 [Ataeniobius toweri]|uniref:Secreted protein n=1 Tax=Ataeniobius toweri TaxID=208326 RepID=A0ABU7B0D7_9TELE|nr:hypothetical protein [Ataeniobius toweri]
MYKVIFSHCCCNTVRSTHCPPVAKRRKRILVYFTILYCLYVDVSLLAGWYQCQTVTNMSPKAGKIKGKIIHLIYFSRRKSECVYMQCSQRKKFHWKNENYELNAGH